jgi:hypothetical protein
MGSIAATANAVNPTTWPVLLLVGIILGMLIMAFIKR